MTLVKPLVPLFLLASFFTAQSAREIAPRAGAESYAAHAQQDGVQIGASFLSRKEVKKNLASEVDQCCLVVEVAFYPPKDNFVKIALDQFTLRETGKDLGVQPLTGDAVAARLELRSPAPVMDQRPTVSSSSEVGYETGRSRDPYGNTTSRSGVYQRESVGVGVPVGGKRETPEANVAEMRRAIAAELRNKGLPETSAWEPVAGYLYFAVTKKSKDGYELVYTLDERKIVLALK